MTGDVVVGYQASVDREAHLANMATNAPAKPTWWLLAVGEDERELSRRQVFEIHWLGRSRTEYGWGDERAHARGRRFGASLWIYTEHPIEFRDDAGWHYAGIGTLTVPERAVGC